VAPLGLREEGGARLRQVLASEDGKMQTAKGHDGASQSNLTIQIPFRLPFSRAIIFFSIKPAIILLTVRVDFPICTAISSCLVFPFSFRILTIASSSKEHFKVSFWHFREEDMSLWGSCYSLLEPGHSGKTRNAAEGVRGVARAHLKPQQNRPDSFLRGR